MRYQSTRNSALTASASEAIVKGLAPDGGLYVPQSIPFVTQEQSNEWSALSYEALCAEILHLFLTDFDTDDLKSAACCAYGASFRGKTAQLIKVHDGLFSLELWHGPTCAFKDYALQLLPRLLLAAKKTLHSSVCTRILVATSGDTGKAALAGFADVPGTEIAVFFPNIGTSEIQRLQMVTQSGNNVHVFAVDGNFDDAQNGVKRAFSDPSLTAELKSRGVCLSSANSINWGRLVPQIVYYFYTYYRLLVRKEVTYGETVDFCVPTGNFGDILAGWYAKKMGLPIGKLVCASNKNNVLTDFFRCGVYNARRIFYKTSSPSMDILISSNLERLLYHSMGEKKTSSAMADLASGGTFTVCEPDLSILTADFAYGWAEEEAVVAEINTRFVEDGYLCDPHTAVAFSVAQALKTSAPMVVLSTASPYKFPRTVLSALDGKAPEDDFAAMDMLETRTGTKAPESLHDLQSAAIRFQQVIAPYQITDVARF